MAPSGSRSRFCTNPGQPFGPIGKIASGGELSRFMLALKAVLARLDTAATLIFDEIDAGVGGATATPSAAGAAGGGAPGAGGDPRAADRRSRPSPLQRRQADGRRADPCRRGELALDERRDEVARMLAGAEVTDAARAAATSLMCG